MMIRRRVLLAVGASLLAAPRAVHAQPAKAVSRVAFLGNASASLSDPLLDAFRTGLRELVASLARPGGNLTGLAFQNQILTMKRLELLKEAIPRISRVAVLDDSTFGVTSGHTQAETAARALQLRLQFLSVRGAADLEAAFQTATTGRAEGLLVLASPFLNANRRTVTELAARRNLPATYEAKTFAKTARTLGLTIPPSLLVRAIRSSSEPDA